VDADPAGSLLRWAELGGWEIPVVGKPTRDLHSRLATIARGFDVVVIDTPPLEDQAGIVHSALRAASDVVVPAAPTAMELDRLAPIFDAVQDIGPLCLDGPPGVSVLLTRTVAGASATAAARDVLGSVGYRVLAVAVPRLERYAQAFGTIPMLIPGDPYEIAAEEIVLGEQAGVLR
jgi:chromosome partitioning protein